MSHEEFQNVSVKSLIADVNLLPSTRTSPIKPNQNFKIDLDVREGQWIDTEKTEITFGVYKDGTTNGDEYFYNRFDMISAHLGSTNGGIYFSPTEFSLFRQVNDKTYSITEKNYDALSESQKDGVTQFGTELVPDRKSVYAASSVTAPIQFKFTLADLSPGIPRLIQSWPYQLTIFTAPKTSALVQPTGVAASYLIDADYRVKIKYVDAPAGAKSEVPTLVYAEDFDNVSVGDPRAKGKFSDLQGIKSAHGVLMVNRVDSFLDAISVTNGSFIRDANIKEVRVNVGSQQYPEQLPLNLEDPKNTQLLTGVDTLKSLFKRFGNDVHEKTSWGAEHQGLVDSLAYWIYIPFSDQRYGSGIPIPGGIVSTNIEYTSAGAATASQWSYFLFSDSALKRSGNIITSAPLS